MDLVVAPDSLVVMDENASSYGQSQGYNQQQSCTNFRKPVQWLDFSSKISFGMFSGDYPPRLPKGVSKLLAQPAGTFVDRRPFR